MRILPPVPVPVVNLTPYSANPDQAVYEALLLCQEGRGAQRRAAEMLGIKRDTLAQRLHRAGEDSPLHLLRAGSDERLAKLLETHGGDRQAVSKATGISIWAIARRILESGPDSPLAAYKAAYRTPSVEHAVFALGWFGGNLEKAAASLGIPTHGLNQQIKYSEPGSSLFPFLVTDVQIAEALRESGGNRAEAARRLGETDPYLLERIRRAEVGSPLEEWKKPRITDEALAKSLEITGRNLRAVAELFGITPQEIIGRISGAVEESPLGRFQVSEEQILSALNRATAGVAHVAARLLGMDHTSLFWRLKHARDPALRNWTRDNPFLHALAAALQRNGGDRQKAAEEMGWSPKRVNIMIAAARPDSVFAPFK